MRRLFGIFCLLTCPLAARADAVWTCQGPLAPNPYGQNIFKFQVTKNKVSGTLFNTYADKEFPLAALNSKDRPLGQLAYSFRVEDRRGGQNSIYGHNVTFLYTDNLDRKMAKAVFVTTENFECAKDGRVQRCISEIWAGIVACTKDD